jgi:hypothetical protein
MNNNNAAHSTDARAQDDVQHKSINMSKIALYILNGFASGAVLGPGGLVVFRILTEGIKGLLTDPLSFFFATLLYGGWCLILPGGILGAFLGAHLAMRN